MDYGNSPIFLHDSGSGPSLNLEELDNVEVSIREGTSVDSLKDKLIYSITLNSKFKYELKLPPTSLANPTNVKLTYDIESINEYFTLVSSPTDTVRLDMNEVPNRIYLHV